MSAITNNVVSPRVSTGSTKERRLINFATGKHDLLPDHTAWLDQLLRDTPPTREFFVDIYGYASRLGDLTKNRQLGYDRANEVARYLVAHDPKYELRIRHFLTFGSEEPGYNPASDSDNDGFERAAEVHYNLDRPPNKKKGEEKKPPPRLTGMKWSCAAYLGLNMNILLVAQLGIGIFKFRNDETMQTHTYVAPLFGIGFGKNILDALSKLREAGKLVGKAGEIASKILNLIEGNPALLVDPRALARAIGRTVLTGASLGDWTDFTKCDVFIPLTFNKIDGATVAGGQGTGGVYQAQSVFVYGWDTKHEPIGTKNFLKFSGGSWQVQVPGLSVGATGGPLLML